MKEVNAGLIEQKCKIGVVFANNISNALSEIILNSKQFAHFAELDQNDDIELDCNKNDKIKLKYKIKAKSIDELLVDGKDSLVDSIINAIVSLNDILDEINAAYKDKV